MPRRSACAKHLSRSATETSHASDPPPPRDRRFGWQQSNSGVATPPDHRGLRGPHRRSEAAPLELASWRHLDPALADRVDDHSERRHDRCLGSLLRSERQLLTECRSDLIPQGSSTSRPARRRRYRQRHQGRSREGQEPGLTTIRTLECADAVPPRPGHSGTLPPRCWPS